MAARARQAVPLYHLTDPDNVPKIMSDGLKAGPDGHIFFYTDPIVAETIAKDQVFIVRYTVLSIDRAGVKGRLQRDRVAEFSAGYHRMVRQATISPEHIRVVGTYDIPADKPTEWDRRTYRSIGWSDEQIDGLWAIMAEARAKCESGELSENEGNEYVNAWLRKRGLLA